MEGLVYVKDGHIFEADADNPRARAYHEIDSDHGGPHCFICEDYWCEYCDPHIFSQKCPGREEETLPGLEYRQPMVKEVVGRRVRGADVPAVRRLRS